MPAPDGAPNGQAVAPVITNDGAPLVREQDRFMPIANVIRIMRRVLPTHAKISDDAKETIQECVSEYISFITSEANDRCQREQRKTITAEDVLWAMSKLGFDDYIEPLGIYLQRFRELEGDNRGAIRGESLVSMRPRTPAADSVAMAAGMYPHMVQNPPPFHAPFPPMAMFGDGMGGYYAGMYSGGGSSSSGGGVADGDNSGQAPMPDFDGYAPYK